jgi:multicomponent Na+:H+ antiporter subunit B
MMNDHVILRIVSCIITPFIILYSLYIQINGESSPGGGFQAGAIMASGFIIYDLLYGKYSFEDKFKTKYLDPLLVAGVSLYTGVGLICMVLGGEFLNYNYLASNSHAAQHLGIFLVEIAVGITVTISLINIYKNFKT